MCHSCSICGQLSRQVNWRVETDFGASLTAMISFLLRVSARPPVMRTQDLDGGERVDEGAIKNLADRHKFTRSVRDREQSGSVSQRGRSDAAVEAGLQETGAHFKAWRLTRDLSDCTGQRPGEPGISRRGGWLGLLEKLHFQIQAAMGERAEDFEDAALLGGQVLLGVGPPVYGERALGRNRVEVRTPATLTATHQPGMPSATRPDRLHRLTSLNFP